MTITGRYIEAAEGKPSGRLEVRWRRLNTYWYAHKRLYEVNGDSTMRTAPSSLKEDNKQPPNEGRLNLIGGTLTNNGDVIIEG